MRLGPELPVALLATGFVAVSAAGHVDDTDGQLYLVVARHLAEDGQWLRMRYLPEVHPEFREHLPFGVWPYAAAIRWAGEGAARWTGALFTVAAAVVAAWTARRLGGGWAGLVAGSVLAVTESLFRYGGLPRLDPPLLFFTAAACAALWVDGVRRPFLIAAALGGAAALIKGPFGLLPVAAAGAARALARRSLPEAGRAALCVAGAALPAAAFLLADRALGEGGYWRGYVLAQVVASATGERMDGSGSALFPLLTVAGRFWPGLPLAAWGAWRCARERRNAELALAAALILLGLMLPGRKVWNHALILYPPLAVLAGLGAAPWLRRWAPERASGAVAALGVAAFGLALSPAGDRLRGERCVASAELGGALEAIPPGAEIAIVSPSDEWRIMAALAAERRLRPYPVTALADARPGPALVKEASWAPAPGWTERGRARGWVLALRRRPP